VDVIQVRKILYGKALAKGWSDTKVVGVLSFPYKGRHLQKSSQGSTDSSRPRLKNEAHPGQCAIPQLKQKTSIKYDKHYHRIEVCSI
jgi:hypothetical protein